MHYLDNAATTPVEPQVVKTIAQVMETQFANPSSLYRPGMESEELIQQSRKTIASVMGYSGKLDIKRPQVVFTASGTEANNLAILGIARARRNWGNHLITTGYEHPSVLQALRMLEQEGFLLDVINPGIDGQVCLEAIASKVGSKTVLVCAMQVNNETGAQLDVVSLGKAIKQANRRTALHVDGVQGFCKCRIALGGPEIDSYAVSGHKIHAPKGIGALYLRTGLQVFRVLTGGDQEGGIRPGTENTPYIAGFAKAASLANAAQQNQAKQVEQLRHQLVEGLSRIQGVHLNSPTNGLPYIINFSLPEVRSETMLHFLEQRKIYVSSGSACSGGRPSQTLEAMRLDSSRVDTALRIGFSGFNTPKDVEALLEGLQDGLASLARPKQNIRRSTTLQEQ